MKLIPLPTDCLLPLAPMASALVEPAAGITENPTYRHYVQAMNIGGGRYTSRGEIPDIAPQGILGCTISSAFNKQSIAAASRILSTNR